MAVTPATSAAVVLTAGHADLASFSPGWAPLLDRPAFAWAVDALDACAVVAEVLLVVPPDRLDLAREIGARSGWRNVRVVAAPRAAAAPGLQLLTGLEALEPEHTTIILHDGARLLLAPELLAAGLSQADAQHLVAFATPVKETIKWGDGQGRVLRTPPREALWSCQTPVIVPRMAVEAGLHGAAAKQIAERSRSGSLAWLVAACPGCHLRIVRAGYDELRIRTPADIEVAEALLRARGLANTGV